MMYAITNDGVKIKAIPNKTAICPICRSVVKSKCGPLNVWHWAHNNLEECDSWNYEPISEWHLKWQKHFKEEQTEVFITKNGETHIADIITEKNTIIEIQNSNISVDEILEREYFYKDMIWVVNTYDFKHNLYFKNYPPLPYQPVWKEYIKKQYDSETIGFKINIPVNDMNNQILSALKKCNYKYDSDDNDSEYWYNLKRSKHEELDKLIINAFEGYLIDFKLSIELETNKMYPTNFRWNHLRKTWRNATKPIFLDMNNEFLFLIKTLYENGNGHGTIVPKKLFLKKYRG